MRFLIPVSSIVVLGALAGCGGGWRPDVQESPLVRKDATLAVALDDDANEIILELPPVDLPAGRADAGADHSGHGGDAAEGEKAAGGDAAGGDGHAAHGGQETEAYIGRMPVGGWLRGYRVELIDAHDRPVPSELLHHMNLISPDRRELFSPIMQRIAAAGQETAPVRLPRIFGYPFEVNERVLLKAMLHNPTPTAYDGVRVRVHLRYTPASTLFAPWHVFPFYLDVMPPAGSHAFDLPPGRSEQSWEGRPVVAGRIAALGGHLHRYAEVLRLEDVTAGKVLWESEPMLDEVGNVSGMPQDFVIRRLGIAIDPAHTYRLTAVYDNPTGTTIVDGGMGALGGVLIVDRNAQWPAVDPADPEYVRDVEFTVHSRDPDVMVQQQGTTPAHSH